MDILNVHIIRNLRLDSGVWITYTLDLLSSLFELFMQEKFVIIENTLVRNLFARLHTVNLSWPGMDI